MRIALTTLILVQAFAPHVLAAQTSADDVPRTGFFSIAMTPNELLGEEGAKRVSEIFSGDETLEWQLYVPKNYDTSRPPGAIVYISPYSKGGPPEAWNDVMRDKNLIWIGARNAGNEMAVTKRMFLAMFAPLVLQRHYVLNAERIYLAGFSGGGKTASRVAVLRPNIFKGGIFASGALFWGREDPPLVQDVLQLHYVFMSGTNDFSLADTKEAHRKFLAAGVENVKLIIIRNHGHKLPDELNITRAIEYLDARLVESTSKR